MPVSFLPRQAEELEINQKSQTEYFIGFDDLRIYDEIDSFFK